MEYCEIRDIKICTLELSLKENILSYCSDYSNYFIPRNTQEIDILRDWIHSLQNGKILCCRGRDIIRDDDGIPSSYTNWETGYAVKMNRRLFLLWDTEVESVLIDGCNYLDQLHFTSILELPLPVPNHSKNRVIIVCHGFCFEDGPNYLFVSALTSALKVAGYRVIIPDFRPSYKYGPTRGRSERIRIIMDEIVFCLGEYARSERSVDSTGNLEFILVGHSQGGAAIGQLCGSEKAVTGANIRGIVMIGSESPVESLVTDMNALLFGVDENTPQTPPIMIHTTPPPIPSENILCIHSQRDRVIHHLMIQQLAERWQCRYVELHSPVEPEHPSVGWADDVQHDFMAKDMLLSVIEMTARFIQNIN